MKDIRSRTIRAVESILLATTTAACFTAWVSFCEFRFMALMVSRLVIGEDTSVPQKEVRGIYFATHFHNFYHEAPIQEIQTYVEDLSLWGVNSLAVWYDMHHFDGIDDPAAQAMLKRIKAILAAAHSVGMSTNLMLVANEAYNNSPKELRAVGPGRGAFFNVELCPHKPGAKDLLLKQFSQEFEALSGVGVDYVTIWPYDSGSCSCELCRPWGSNGFLYIAQPVSSLARHYFPHAQVILSTWFFDRPEWDGLVRALGPQQAWVNYIMAEPGAHEVDFLKLPIPDNLPLVGFPEISMEGMYPWGGFGANPQPARFQKEWNRVKDRVQGGFPYSEGIFEDLDKVIFAQFYWDPNKDVFDTVREYLSFEFSPIGRAGDDEGRQNPRGRSSLSLVARCARRLQFPRN